MKTEREDFSSRALLAINMKEEMLLRRMLCYIVIVPLVRAQRYTVLPRQAIYLCSYDSAKEQKDVRCTRTILCIRPLYSRANVCCGRYFNSALRTLE